MGASQAISSHKSMTGVWCYLWCYPACHTLQDFCLQEVELWWNYWCPLLHVMRTWQNHLPIERKVDRPSLKKSNLPNAVLWVTAHQMLYFGLVTVYSNYSRFWTTVRNPKLPGSASPWARMRSAVWCNSPSRAVSISVPPTCWAVKSLVFVMRPNQKKTEENCQEFEM